MRIGYARVSTQDQNLDLKRDALRQAGCDKIIEDTASGGKARRSGLDRVRELLRPGGRAGGLTAGSPWAVVRGSYSANLNRVSSFQILQFLAALTIATMPERAARLAWATPQK